MIPSSSSAQAFSDTLPKGRVRASGEPIDIMLEQKYLDCVGYVVSDVRWKGNWEREPVGTCFLIEHTVDGSSGIVHYAVTAKHIVLSIQHGKKRQIRNMFLRLNKTTGGVENHKSGVDRWYCAEDTDLAISRIDLSPEVRFWAYPIWQPEPRMNEQAEVGQRVCMIGLFAPLPGTREVEALVRTGTVARPYAKVDVEICTAAEAEETQVIDGCIVQATAWGGESGSPVFVYDAEFYLESNRLAQFLVDEYGSRTAAVRPEVTPRLLGILASRLVVGDELQLSDTKTTHHREVLVNAGLGVVVPRKKLVDLLQRSDVVADREMVRQEIESGKRPMTRSAIFLGD